jgi:hypothetical protein
MQEEGEKKNKTRNEVLDKYIGEDMEENEETEEKEEEIIKQTKKAKNGNICYAVILLATERVWIIKLYRSF